MSYIKENRWKLLVELLLFIAIWTSFGMVWNDNNQLREEITELEAEKMELQYKLHRSETDNHLLIRELGK